MQKFSKHNSFSGMHINMRNLRNKIDQLDMLLQLHSITCELDILFLTETWLTGSYPVPLLDGYRSMHLRRENKRGDGVSAYIKDTISFMGIEEFSEITNDFECLAFHVRKMTVCVIYRPPMGNKRTFYTFLERLLTYACSRNESCTVMGFLNINMALEEGASLELKTLLSCHGCVNHIMLQARIDLNSAILLDVCISNFCDCDISTGVPTVDISDHFAIFFFIETHSITDDRSPQPRFFGKVNHGTI